MITKFVLLAVGQKKILNKDVFIYYADRRAHELKHMSVKIHIFALLTTHKYDTTPTNERVKFMQYMLHSTRMKYMEQ